MSSTVPELEVARPPDALLLVDRLPRWLRMTRGGFVLTAVLGCVFAVFSHYQLHYTDLWGHLQYGRLIVESRALPATEPFMPLARGVPMMDTAWLSQVVAYLAQARWGAPALQFLHGAIILICTAALAWRMQKVGGRVWLTLCGLLVFTALNWTQFQVVRPQMAGLACFLLLLCRVTGRPQTWDWLAIPALLGLWANLHGSFLVGLLLLACLAAGRAFDTLRRHRTIAALGHDRLALRALLLLQLGAAATLVNPYGLRLYTEVLSFSGNANLQSLIEWQPLQVRSLQGMCSGALALALVFAYRASPRRLPAAEVLALIALGFAALWTQRMLVWWTGPAALALVVNLAAIFDARRAAAPSRPEPMPAGLWSVASVGAAWVLFALTPFGHRVMHGPSARLEQPFAEGTPMAATEYLVKNPPKGQVFNTYEWGDYLLWAGPPGLKVFVNSHAHLVPSEVWKDYLVGIEAVSEGVVNDVLDRYSVNTVVVDKQERGLMIARLKRLDTWKLAYDDGVAAIFVRKQQL